MNTKLPLIAALMAVVSTNASAHSGTHGEAGILQFVLHLAGSSYHIAGITLLLLGIVYLAIFFRHKKPAWHKETASAKVQRRS